MTQIKISALRPYPKNARTHSPKQIRQIAKSIKSFGFTNPVLIDKDNCILAGSNRTRIPDLLQISPCVRRLWRQKRPVWA